MTYKNSTFLTIFIFLFSCNNQQQETTQSKSATKSDIANCYRYINKNDTVILKTIAVGNLVTGTLEYYFHGQDRKQGTIQGYMRNELLIANYTSFSEGVPVKQVAFKKDGNTYIEGNGETINSNEKVSFKNIDSLSFTNSIVLNKIDCKK